MDKEINRLAILLGLKISRVENGNYEPLFNRRFNLWQYRLSHAKELLNDDLAPAFNEIGQIVNASYSKVNKNGVVLSEEHFIVQEIEHLKKLNREVLKPSEKVTFDGYLKYVESRNNEQRKKSKVFDYPLIGAFFAQGFIKKEKGIFYFKDETFKVAARLHERISEEIKKVFGIDIKPDSIKLYVSDTLSGKNTDKNFYKNETKHLNTVKFCEDKNIPITKTFRNILNN